MYNIFDITIKWEVIGIEFLIVWIICLILSIKPWIKIKIIKNSFCKRNYDKPLKMIKKLKNSRYDYRGLVKEYTLKNEMIIHCFLNNREKFENASNEYGKEKNFSEFCHILFYLVNDNQNKELEKLITDYKEKHGATPRFKYLDILIKIKNYELESAKTDYCLIRKKIKHKILKQYLTECLKKEEETNIKKF